MSTMKLEPKNLLMLAALGIGAYWFMTRKAYAGTSGFTSAIGQRMPRTATGNVSQQPNVMAGLFAGLGSFLGGGSTPNSGTYQIDNTSLPGSPGFGWEYFSDGVAIGPDGTYYKNGVAVWSPSGNDLVASNPVSSGGATGGWDTSAINGMW